MPLLLEADPACSPGRAGVIPAFLVPAELAALRGCETPPSTSSGARIAFWVSFLVVGCKRGVCPSFLLDFVLVLFGGIWVHLAGSDWLWFSALTLTKAQHEVWQQVTAVYQDTQQMQPRFLASSSVCGFHGRCCNLEISSQLSTADEHQTIESFRGHLTAVSSTQYAPQKCHAKQDIEQSNAI